MVTSHTESFTTAVRETDASVTTTTTADFEATLTSTVEEPAVGTPLPFDGVGYDGTPVDASPTGADLPTATTGVTPGSLGIVDYGSVVLEEHGHGEELVALYPEIHVVVVAASDIVDDMKTAIDVVGTTLTEQTTDAIIATGPSATADMGSLVTGVHGPRDVHVVVLEDR